MLNCFDIEPEELFHRSKFFKLLLKAIKFTSLTALENIMQTVWMPSPEYGWDFYNIQGKYAGDKDTIEK